jgi:hypothetical protein
VRHASASRSNTTRSCSASGDALQYSTNSARTRTAAQSSGQGTGPSPNLLAHAREPFTQRGEIDDRLALTRHHRLQLVGPVARGEDLLGQGALSDLGSPPDVDLAAQRRPMEQQREMRVVPQVASLARPQRGGEYDGGGLDAAHRHNPGRRAAARSRRGERHRVVLRQAGSARILHPLRERAQRPDVARASNSTRGRGRASRTWARASRKRPRTLAGRVSDRAAVVLPARHLLALGVAAPASGGQGA